MEARTFTSLQNENIDDYSYKRDFKYIINHKRLRPREDSFSSKDITNRAAHGQELSNEAVDPRRSVDEIERWRPLGSENWAPRYVTHARHNFL